MSDINIKIPILDQAAELAKDFIQKVIAPPLEEVGGLIADQVKFWRFKNQVTIVTKAEEYLRKKNINTKKVSLKVLAPLLEDCSLEEDESLQQKWIALLVNTVKEGSEIENPLYSYLLSQLSANDAKLLQQIFDTQDKIGIEHSASVFSEKRRMFFANDLKRNNPEWNLSIDNLFRLRLVHEMSKNMNTLVSMTDLGIQFLKYCTLPD